MLNRRSFIKALSLVASASALGVLPLTSAEEAPVPKLTHEFKSEFFAMDTGTQDATHHTPAEQVALAKEIGFAGVGPIYHNLAELQAWCASLDQNGLKLFAVYVPLPLDDPSASLDSIRQITAALKGRDTLLWLYVTDKGAKPSATNDDTVAVDRLREISGLAKAAGLRVALYPHTGFYVQRVEDCVRLADKVNLENLGVTFNLCHWLMVDGKDLAVGVENDVRDFRRQVPRQNAGQTGRGVDRQRPVVDLVEAPLEQKHLHKVRIGQDRDGVVAVRQLHYGKP